MDFDPHSSGISLARLLPESRFHRTDDLIVSSCSSDHSRCRPGDLYVALMRPELDGHDFAQAAVDAGASAVLTERLLPLEIPQCIVSNTKVAFARLCHSLAGNPGTRLPLVAVAGDRGVTATQALLTTVIESVGGRPAAYGHLGETDGFEAFPRNSARVSPAQAAKWLAHAVANECTHAIAELPSAELKQRSFTDVPLQMLLLTGFNNRSPAPAKVTPRIRADFELLMAQLSPESLVVINKDCPLVCELAAEISNPMLTVSVGGQADLSATITEELTTEQTFLLNAGSDTVVVRTRMIGRNHITNCLMAAAASLGFGNNLTRTIEAIESVQSIPGHLEYVSCGQPFSVHVDSGQSPIELQRSLKTLRRLTTGKIICVFGQGDADDKVSAAQRGTVVERFADLGVITSDDCHDESPLRATYDVLDGYRNPAKAHVMPNRLRAIEWSLSQARPGDAVLLVGPHNGRAFQDDDEFMSDRDVARYFLYKHAGDAGTPDWHTAWGESI